jgi:hypothetical protein
MKTNNFRKISSELMSEVKGGRYIIIIAPDGTRYRVWI